MICDFKPGDKLVCVGDRFPGNLLPPTCMRIPVVGEIYTCGTVHASKSEYLARMPGYEVALEIVEISTFCQCWNHPMIYPWGWFRKVVKTEQSEFEKLVAPYRAKKKEPVPA